MDKTYENSDKHFIEKIRPYITKAEMNKRLRPLGLTARGKGRKFGEKRDMIEVYIDDKAGNIIRAVFSGSHYVTGDNQIGVYLYGRGHGIGMHEIESYIKNMTNRPKRDAEWLLNALVQTCKDAAFYEYIKINS